VVRLKHAGALEAEVAVRPEFAGSAFEAKRGVDYELVLGADRNGIETEELAPGRLRVRAPALERDGQTGFAVRAKFLGDGDGQEPPKSLLVEIVRVVDVTSGRELPLDPESGR
jgi:hypothetical protein